MKWFIRDVDLTNNNINSVIRSTIYVHAGKTAIIEWSKN